MWSATSSPSKCEQLDPKTLKWTSLSAKGKKDFNAEEGWTLLANGTILTADVKIGTQLRDLLDRLEDNGQTAGSTIVDLHSPSTLRLHSIMGRAANFATTRLERLARKFCVPMARCS